MGKNYYNNCNRPYLMQVLVFNKFTFSTSCYICNGLKLRDFSWYFNGKKHQITQILVDWHLYHSTFSSLALGCQIIIFFFITHFTIKNSNKISAMDVGSFFGRFSRLWTFKKTWNLLKNFKFFFFFFFLEKMQTNDVPPNYRIQKCHQLLNTYFTMVHWLEARSS
jgi:hypothetical protein